MDRMTRLVQTLLRLASLDAGGIAFAPAPCPLTGWPPTPPNR
ncbi:MAG: hypothetical protein ACLUUL_04700 [Gemmiger sp.]